MVYLLSNVLFDVVLMKFHFIQRFTNVQYRYDTNFEKRNKMYSDVARKYILLNK